MRQNSCPTFLSFLFPSNPLSVSSTSTRIRLIPQRSNSYSSGGRAPCWAVRACAGVSSCITWQNKPLTCEKISVVGQKLQFAPECTAYVRQHQNDAHDSERTGEAGDPQNAVAEISLWRRFSALLPPSNFVRQPSPFQCHVVSQLRNHIIGECNFSLKAAQ